MAALYIGHSARLRKSWINDRNLEHRRLLVALRERDGERAAALIVQHLDATLAALTTPAAVLDDRRAATAARGQPAL